MKSMDKFILGANEVAIMEKKDICDIYCYDEKKVEIVQRNLETVDFVNSAQVLKAIADENRAKIVYALCLEKELCVCDLANIIGITIANTSHHLRTLYKKGIVQFEKRGKLAFYSLEHEGIKQIVMLLMHKK